MRDWTAKLRDSATWPNLVLVGIAGLCLFGFVRWVTGPEEEAERGSNGAAEASTHTTGSGTWPISAPRSVANGTPSAPPSAEEIELHELEANYPEVWRELGEVMGRFRKSHPDLDALYDKKSKYIKEATELAETDEGRAYFKWLHPGGRHPMFRPQTRWVGEFQELLALEELDGLLDDPQFTELATTLITALEDDILIVTGLIPLTETPYYAGGFPLRDANRLRAFLVSQDRKDLIETWRDGLHAPEGMLPLPENGVDYLREAIRLCLLTQAYDAAIKTSMPPELWQARTREREMLWEMDRLKRRIANGQRNSTVTK